MEGEVVGLRTRRGEFAAPPLDYEDFFENGAIGLHFVDAHGTILRANRAELALLGYSAEDYFGRPIADFHADADVIADILARLKAGERLDRYPARLKAKDGSIKHVLISSSVNFQDGQFVNTRCFSVDVTAAVEAEAARRAAEERLASTYENATVGLGETDAEGRFIHVNPAFADLTGLSRDELVGRHFKDITHPDDRREDLALYEDQVTGKRDRYRLEKRYVRPDGEEVFVEVLSSSVRDADGALKYAVRVAKDITERKRAEQRLQESERRSRELLDALPMAVYTTDPEGVLTYFNEAAAVLAARRPELGKDKWCVSWKLYRPDGTALPHDQCPMAVAIKTGEEARGVEAILERPDGDRRVFTPFPTLLRDSAGQVTGAINVLVDITDLKRADEEQKVLIDELNHRVKNTLATVQSLSLHTHKSSPEAFVERFEERIIALSRTHDLLTRRRWSGVELGELLQGEFAPYGEPSESRIVASGPDLTLSPRAGLALGMAVHELATNAAKYGALSSASGRVRVSWTVEGSAGGQRLTMTWVEEGGPPVEAPKRKGFGRRLIERNIGKDLHGEVALLFEPGGLQCRMSFPLP